MKKQGFIIISLLAGMIVVHEFYILWVVLRIAAKEYLTNWSTLTGLGLDLLLLIGLIRYILTRGQRSLTLRLGLFFYFFMLLFNLLILLFYFGSARQGIYGQNDDIAQEILKDRLHDLPYLLATYGILIALNRSWLAAAKGGTAKSTTGGSPIAETTEPAEVGKEMTPWIEDVDIRPVSKWMRLLIHTIDVAAVFLVFNLQYVPILLLWRNYLILPYPALVLALKWVLVGLLFLYYLLIETITGTSLGKMITGTMIVDHAGRPASFGELLGRTFARIIPFDSLSFLFRKRGWHDALSDTYVVGANA